MKRLFHFSPGMAQRELAEALAKPVAPGVSAAACAALAKFAAC
jgi:hypothetical protein